MKVFLTGGSGLVGSHVAEHLLRAGHEVRALVQRRSNVDFLTSLGVETISGDVTDPNSLEGALRGCEGLVHAAAVITKRTHWDRFERVNVQGTENVLAAARAQGVRRVVHVSSVAVYGGAEVAERGPLDESAPIDSPLAPGEHYGRSKRAAELVAWRYHREGALEVTTVRPSVIYGERDRVVIPLLSRYLAAPVVLLVGTGDQKLPLVYVGNVAEGIALALTSARAPGRAFNLADDFPVSQRQFFSLIAQRLERRPIFLPLPYALASGAAKGLERATWWLGNRRPLVSRRHIAFMGLGNPFISQRARSELGWQPQTGHREGVRRAVAWYLEQGASGARLRPKRSRQLRPTRL